MNRAELETPMVGTPGAEVYHRAVFRSGTSALGPVVSNIWSVMPISGRCKRRYIDTRASKTYIPANPRNTFCS
jgi:hypothetical protein